MMYTVKSLCCIPKLMQCCVSITSQQHRKEKKQKKTKMLEDFLWFGCFVAGLWPVMTLRIWDSICPGQRHLASERRSSGSILTWMVVYVWFYWSLKCRVPAPSCNSLLREPLKREHKNAKSEQKRKERFCAVVAEVPSDCKLVWNPGWGWAETSPAPLTPTNMR